MSEVVTSVMMNQQQGEEEEELQLPPGFRFHPTDEEVVSHYLTPKALNRFFSCLVMADVDLNKCEPSDLPGMAKMGREKEWYFFCHKDRKYPAGTRTNRATATGYWKATGRDREIFRGRRGVLVGMRKTLVFYLGRAPRGEKTPWVMHEFRLEGSLPPNLPRAAKDEWAVCRVFNKDLAARKDGQPAAGGGTERSNSSSLAFLDDFLLLDNTELPPLTDSPSGGRDDDDDDLLLDFKQGGAAVAGMSMTMSTSSSGYQQAVKTEQQQKQKQSLPPPGLVPQQEDHPYGYCFSVKAEEEDMAWRPLYPPETMDDDLQCPDYSNLWKF